MLQISFINQNIEEVLQRGLQPSVITPRKDSETWWVLRGSALSSRPEWSLWQTGDRVIVPLISYAVPRTCRDRGVLELCSILCNAAIRQANENLPRAESPRIIGVIGETNYQPSQPPEGTERLWLGLALVDSPKQ